MTMLREWFARLRGACGGRRRDADLEEELRLHLELAIEDERRRTDAPDRAGRVARVAAGGVAQTMEALRDQRGLPWLETLAQDVRYALRACRHRPGFTSAIVLSLALGIGLNTAIFSTLNALLLRVLPVRRPEQLVLLRPASAGPRAIPQFSFAQFTALRDATPASDGLAAMSRVARMYATLDADSSRQTTMLQLVSGEYFSLLGLTPTFGRLLGPEDNQTLGGHPVAVISDAFWRRRFGGATDVVGHGLTVNGTHLTIVGVAPPNFSGVWLEAPVDLWVPLVMQANVKYSQNYYNNNGDHTLPFLPQTQIRWLDIIGRAADGVRTLQTPLAVVFQQSVRSDAETVSDPGLRRVFLQQTLTLIPFAQGLSNLRGQFAPPLYALLGMAALILILTCANTANLLLARAEARRREIAVRLSIGASRARVIRQLLTESAVLVLAAAAIGLLFAGWAGNALVRMALATTGPLPFSATLDARVLAFTLLMALLTVLLFGLAPAYRGTRLDLASALKTSVGGGRSGVRVQQTLVVAQVALSLVLVVAAGLLVDTLRNYLRIDLGFTPARVMSVWISPRGSGFEQDRLPQLYRDLVASVEQVPGVQSAAVAVCGLAVGCDQDAGVDIDGYHPQPGERISLQENQISRQYFDTVGMRLLEGRAFDDRDINGSPQVAIVNRASVRRYFGGQSPIGRRFGDGRGRFEIVGVVEDARVNRIQDAANPMAFYPLDQMMDYVGTLEVRAVGDPQAIASEVRRAVAAVDHGLPIDRITMLSRQIELNLSQERLVAQLASFFGLLALGLACVGLCGVLSYVVSRRTTEFGIRMALGASGARVGRSVLYDALLLTVLGLVVGIPTVVVTSRALARLLFGITPTDPLTIVCASAGLVLAAILAGVIPAWRASHVDPWIALRAE